jgi:hypothetical protein
MAFSISSSDVGQTSTVGEAEIDQRRLALQAVAGDGAAVLVGERERPANGGLVALICIPADPHGGGARRQSRRPAAPSSYVTWAEDGPAGRSTSGRLVAQGELMSTSLLLIWPRPGAPARAADYAARQHIAQHEGERGEPTSIT